MGIFSRNKAIDPMFTLPSVFSKECVELFFPKKSLYPMANMRWIEIQMKKGEGGDFWVNRIFDSEEYWRSQGQDLQPVFVSLVQAGSKADSFSYDEESWSTLYTSAKFGLLAGKFEQASGATKPKDCHPITWNALTFLNQAIEDEHKAPFAEKHQMLLITMPYAGYVMGKLGNVTAPEVYSGWNS
jgi:hypothetical protein